MVFGMNNGEGNVIPPLIFPNNLRFNMETFVKFLDEAVQSSGFWKTSCLATGLSDLLDEQDNSVLAVRKFLQLHHP